MIFFAKMQESPNHHYVSAIMVSYAAQICVEFWGCSFETSRKNEQTPPIFGGNWTSKETVKPTACANQEGWHVFQASTKLREKNNDDKLHFCLHLNVYYESLYFMMLALHVGLCFILSLST